MGAVGRGIDHAAYSLVGQPTLGDSPLFVGVGTAHLCAFDVGFLRNNGRRAGRRGRNGFGIWGAVGPCGRCCSRQWVGALAWRWRRPRLLVAPRLGLCLLSSCILITTVQVWDRYLAAVGPLAGMVASGPLVACAPQSRLPEWSRGLLLLLRSPGCCCLHRGHGGAHRWRPRRLCGLTAALRGCRSTVPIGGEPLAGLRWSSPASRTGVGGEGQSGMIHLHNPAILYHQVLGWHFRFYLYDELQPGGDRSAAL